MRRLTLHICLPGTQYEQYSANPSPAVQQTSVRPAVAQAPPVAAGDAQKPLGGQDAAAAAGVSDAPPPPGQRIISREERVEYRDQDGNVLDAEQVKALEGKVEFKTRYETRTRLIDLAGNEIPNPDEPKGNANGAVGVAPPHPDVEGVDKSTVEAVGAAADAPKSADKSRDGEFEAEQSRARPASEGNEATAAGEA